jgi:hypothetical protein
MDIDEPRGARPSAKFFDQVFADIVESERHCAAYPERVSTDSRGIVSGVEQFCKDDTFADGKGDLGGRNMGTWRDETDGH